MKRMWGQKAILISTLYKIHFNATSTFWGEHCFIAVLFIVKEKQRKNTVKGK